MKQKCKRMLAVGLAILSALSSIYGMPLGGQSVYAAGAEYETTGASDRKYAVKMNVRESQTVDTENKGEENYVGDGEKKETDSKRNDVENKEPENRNERYRKCRQFHRTSDTGRK